MNKFLTTASLIAFTVTASSAHAAQQWPLWYLGLSGGIAFLQDSDISGSSTGDLGYDDGAIGTLALGYMIPSGAQPFSNIRLEGELGYHYNSLDTFSVGGGPATAATQHLQMWSLMGNLYYDFRSQSSLTPYVGAGAGVARVELGKNSGLGNTEDMDRVFAYQFMGGISYAPKSLPLTEWGLGYRYFTAKGPNFATAGGKLDLDDVVSHSAEINAKFRF